MLGLVFNGLFDVLPIQVLL